MGNRIFKNFSLLLFIEIISMMIPFFMIPVLIKAFDVGMYGRLVYVQVIFSYFIVLIQFGFNLTATKLIAENKSDLKAISQITTAVITIKIILFLISSFSIFCISLFMSEQESIWLMMGLLIIFVEILNLQWFYQAVGKLQIFSIVTVVGKLCVLLSVIILVQSPADDITYFIILGVGGLIPAFVLMMFFLKTEKIFLKFNKQITIKIAKEGISIFISRVSVIFSERILITILGVHDLQGEKVAIFDLASKFVTVLNSPYAIFNNIYYPISVKEKSTISVVKVISILLASSTIGYALIFFTFQPLVDIYLPNVDSALVYQVLMVLYLSVPLNIVSQYAV